MSHKLSEYIGVVDGKINVADSVMYSYIGLSAGDLLSGLLSQYFRSRRKVVMGYIISLLCCFLFYIFNHDVTQVWFYFMCFMLGASTGYWALFVTIASEQFGTNLRSTVTNTVPNFVRGAVVPITLSFKYLKDNYNIETAALVVGLTCISLALVSVIYVKETFSKDLNYFETE